MNWRGKNKPGSPHAKPILTPLIRGESSIPIKKSNARSIALYAFKTAVVVDAAARRPSGLFFSRRLRHAFKQHLHIPTIVQMWMCACIPRRGVGLEYGYFRGQVPPAYSTQFYVCTCRLGNFVFQLVTVKQPGLLGFVPFPGFENLLISFWPEIIPGFIWPGNPPRFIRQERFKELHQRWASVQPFA